MSSLPDHKVEMFWDVRDSPKIQLLSMPFRPGAKKISAVPWRTAYPSVAQGGRSCKSPKAAWCRLKDQIRWALLCLQPTEESHVFFHSLRCLSISCHVVMSSWKLPPPPSFTYRQQLCLSGKRAAGGSQFEGKSTWDAEGLWCPRSSAWKPCD